MRYALITLLFISAGFVNTVKAQQPFNYPFRHITQQDGLLHNEVYAITQDGKGFMWIATKNGLQRYDGYNFIQYPELLIDPKEGVTYINNLFADKKNKLLWAGNSAKMEIMDLTNNHFTLFNPDIYFKDSIPLWPKYYGDINEPWLLGNDAVYYYDSVAKKFCFYDLIAKHGNQVSSITRDSNNIWLANSSKLLLFDKKTKKLYSENFNPHHHPLLERKSYKSGKLMFRYIMADSRHNIWLTTWDNFLYKYDADTKKLISYSLTVVKNLLTGHTTPDAPPVVNCMLEDDNNTIWVGAEYLGLLRYNKEKDNFDYCIPKEMNSNSIQYNYRILCLFQDKEQNIWVGTDKGISIFNPYRQYFTSIRHQEKNSLSVSKSEIDAFIQTTDGNIFIGTWGGGIALYDKQFNFKKNIFFNEGTEKNLVWCFMQMDAQTLWIGCQTGQLLQYNLITGKTQTLFTPEFEKSTIRCMQKDSAGNIWFGLNIGKIAKWDKKKQQFFAYPSHTKYIFKRPARVIDFIIDKAQHCWVSTTSGFKEFDLEKGVYINNWLPDKNNANSISAKYCNGIEELNDSTLLIGTIYGGLNFFNKTTKIFTSITTADGLPSNNINAIKKDSAGYVWFTTDYGIYKFNPANKKFIPYTMESGVINGEFTAQRIYTLQDGQWLTYTGTEAISFFPYKAAYPNNLNPTIEITGFKIFDKAIFIDSFLNENKPVQLSYRDNFFTVEFAVLNFSGQHKTNYYYLLKGIDKNWVNGGTKRFASYTDLQPGEYIFEVKAEQGDNSGAVTSFKIIITPPFWKTWWFILGSVLLICLSVYWLFHKRVSTVRREAALKQTIAETEMMALRAQMNPHFIFNCLNSIDNLIQEDEKEKATLYLAKFAKLIRSILENSKNNVLPCWKDMETLQLYIELEELRCDKKFIYKINIADEILNGDYKVPPLVIQPFVENAIHHGLFNKIEADKKLTVTVSAANNHIYYCIEDNGVGRAKAAAYKNINKPLYESMGMQITTDRINLFNQNKNGFVKITDLVNEHNEPAGTRVEVELINQS